MTGLADHGLRLRFFHHWSDNRLAFLYELELTMYRETGSGRA